MKSLDTLIIGGGISGLSAAAMIKQNGGHCQLWETNSQPGGLIKTNQSDGFITEQAASMILNFKPEVTAFMQQSGLQDKKQAREEVAHRYLIHKGQLQKMPLKLLAMARSPLWDANAKWHMLTEWIRPARRIENETVTEFIQRRLGKTFAEQAMSAYVSGILASDPDLANARSVLPHLTALEQRYGSLTLGVLVRKFLQRQTASHAEGFSFKGGMQNLIDTLSRNQQIYTDHQVVNIEAVTEGWQVTANTPQGEKCCCTKRLILATPATATATLLGDLKPELSKLLSHIRYAPISVVHIGLRRKQVRSPLDGMGFLTPRHETLAINGSMWISSLFPDRCPEDHVLLSNYLGGARHPKVTELTHAQKTTLCLDALKNTLGISGAPAWLKVDHHPRAMPLYHGAYPALIRDIQHRVQSLPGIYLLGNYIGGSSIRDRIVCANQLVANMAQHEPNELAVPDLAYAG